MKERENIVIVGAGLSGLTLAYLLSKEGHTAKIVEASDRIGGRIQTIRGKNETPLELGATWFSDMHVHLIDLLQELEIDKFPQFTQGKSLFQATSYGPPQEFVVPENESPSYRISGGTQSVIQALYNRLKPEQVQLNAKVVSIEETEAEMRIHLENEASLAADRVVVCMPPQLISSQLKFSPELPKDVSNILPEVQTWMGGSIKFVLEYSESFWRNRNYSGMIYGQAGIIAEMYDHTNFEANKFGFTGFLNNGAVNYSKDERKEMVLQQLTASFGEEAANPLKYEDKIWTDAFILDENPMIRLPHQNNGHASLQKAYMNGKLFFAGTETDGQFSGKMESAIISAKRVFQRLMVD